MLKIGDDGLKFAAQMLDNEGSTQQARATGRRDPRHAEKEKGWPIVQLPQVEAAFVAASRDGANRALVGGFDFRRTSSTT